MILEKNRIINDRYKIIEKIGVGGMAIVYKAKDLKLDREITFKVLKEEFIEDQEFINRFSTEAIAAAQLSDANIVSVYDVGNDGDIYYIVMEYIDGFTLKELIYNKAPFSNNDAAEIAIQIASALDHAHLNGIVHRDIKPENVLITKIGDEGKAMVTDFGIAKAAKRASDSDDYMGSIHYFSPEQAKGDDVDKRSDIYSLGIVLYEMLTGELPFDGDEAIDLAMQHIKNPIPDPRDINPQVTEILVDIIKKACSKEPKNRYQNAREMINDLKHAISESKLSWEEIEEDIEPVNSDKNGTRKYNPNDLEDIDDDDYFYDDEEEKEYRTKEIRVIIAAVITGIVLIGALTFGSRYISKTLYGDTIRVPDFVGMSYDKACIKAERKGITVERKDVYEEDTASGDIARQSPEKGERINAGDVVILYVSQGAGDIQVPSLENLSKSKAEEVLEKQGLRLGDDVEYVHSDKPIGTVISQSPEAGSMVSADTEISIRISQGSIDEEIPMPDCRSKMKEEAEKLLDEAGISGRFIEGYSDTVESGYVIDQGIEPGTMIAVGSNVILTVSKGRNEETNNTEDMTYAPVVVPPVVEINTQPQTQPDVPEPPIEEKPVEQEAPKSVSIPVNPSQDSLTDSNSLRITATTDGVERVVREGTFSKEDFPFTVSDSTTGSTEYKVYVNGEVIHSETR